MTDVKYIGGNPVCDVTAREQVEQIGAKASQIDALDTRVTAVEGDVDALDGQLQNISESVNGVYVENYTEGKDISASGVVGDNAYMSLSDYIPVTWTWDSSKYNRFYYTDDTSDSNATSYRIVFYDSDKNYLGFRGGSSGSAYRAVVGYDNLAYVRFTFKRGFSGKITNSANPPTIEHWIAQSSLSENGIIQSMGNLSNLATTDKDSLVDAINEVDTKTDKCLNDSYLDNSMVNRINPVACQINTRVNLINGVIQSYNNYFTTDYIAIGQGETIYVYRPDTVERRNISWYALYDENKTFISGSNVAVDSITQSGNVAYVLFSFLYLAGDISRTPNGVACLSNPKPPYITGYGNNPVFKSEYIREIVNVYSTDTEAQIINKFIHAFETGNCDVCFERAHYTFGTEMAKVNTDYGMLHNEIPIGNGCRYYFNGSTLTATLDLSQQPAGEGEDEFYCNFFGCQRRPSSYELHDAVLVATDTRYVVHDESSAMNGDYRHLYHNIEMEYHTASRQESIRKCIGGGTGRNGVVEIDGCKFTTDATDNAVTYHGNGSDSNTAEFDLVVKNSWFSNGIRLGALATNQTARLFYTGNSATHAPVIYSGVTETSFLNEVRS